jgi:hypothetical protein
MTYSEAREDARRLTKALKRDVEVATVRCCEYDPSCSCGGEGVTHELRYTFCQHVVQDDPREESDCRDNDCEHKEYKAFCERTNKTEAA